MDKRYKLRGQPEVNERTEKRLNEIKEMGLVEVGTAQFGIPKVMSGLYIEMVWSYNDEEWKGYLEWVKALKQ
jgi:hypothetical protein